MSPIIRGNLHMAWASIRSTRWRSTFTILGVVVAIVPVLTILSIGEGVKRQVNDQVNELGSDLITIRPGRLVNSNNPIEQFNTLSGYTTAGAFTDEDLKAVRDSKAAGHVSPLAVVPGALSINDKTVDNTFVVAATEDLPQLINHKVQHGGFFKDKDFGRKTAVIGRGAAEKLFGEGVPLGRAFDFRDETFVIGGVLERFEATPLSFMADLNNAVIIPYPLAQTFVQQVPIYEILARADAETTTEDAVQKLESSLATSRGGEKDFSVVTQEENLRVTNRILGLITALVTGVAAIALLVSGISIMNIMLVSVAERMHEIGVRKAIGATRRQIIGQFLSEAVILSLIGGVLGVILSFVVVYFIRLFTTIEPVITWQAGILVVGVSLFVGVVFGSIPALKAARKNPIDALRHE